MSVRAYLKNALTQSLRDAASRVHSNASPPSEPVKAAESGVLLRDVSRAAVEHVAKLPPETLRAEQEITYDWDYSARRAELRTLYEKSKTLNWNARTDLDWSTDVDPEREIVADSFNPIFGTDVWRRLDKKTEVPRTALMDGVKARTRYAPVRSDWLTYLNHAADPQATAEMPALPPGFSTTAGKPYIDFHL